MTIYYPAIWTQMEYSIETDTYVDRLLDGWVER